MHLVHSGYFTVNLMPLRLTYVPWGKSALSEGPSLRLLHAKSPLLLLPTSEHFPCAVGCVKSFSSVISFIILITSRGAIIVSFHK